ncbi:helix-turn-helix domain-containing protein [Methylobacterium sp. J-077]|uniref:helix-turn-helix domain-containing protein n=1 Tax=Methylobacterium sp. J-077 TaxID=2836656 RepID=UPI001FBB81AF|nr:helix-turn-helix domain-containing protein [Methylobacterium sp. J-077]MCJ2121357.1 helix-turn-helix domain-containing protein [Methylobacterium sp. J-077]
MARRSLSDIMASAPDIDTERLDATTDEDIRRYKAAEGYDAENGSAGQILSVPAAAELREQMKLTQGAFARLLRIPVATLRNWEQGRKMPDPAARTLLALIAADPVNAQRILAGEARHSQASATDTPDVIQTAVTFARLVGARTAEPANVNHTLDGARALA